MPVAAAEAFHAWHDFYVLIGTASATLIGAMFVVASIGSGFLTRRHEPQIRAYLTPPVIHLSTVVLSSALAMVPSLDWQSVAAIFGAGGIAGMGYSSVIGWRIARTRIEWTDQLWYALIPIVAYAIIVAAALTIVLRTVPNFEALAVGVVLLLIAGIRNSWDMIIFFAARDKNPE